MIACVDDAIGGVLAALDRSGRRDDTVVIFTSDHGDHLGDHRLMLKGAEQYQSIVRVPFIWSDPEASGDPPRTDALGFDHGHSATVLERARIEPFSGMQGSSLTAGAARRSRVRATACSSSTTIRRPSPGTDVPARVHTLIDDRYRLSVFHGTGWGELYDLKNDPGEFDNLWDDPAHAADARAHDGAAAAGRDRAHRPRAAADAQGVIASRRAPIGDRRKLLFGDFFLVFLRVLADESVPVGHAHLRQRLRVHRIVLADDLVEREHIGGQSVDLVVGERLRLRPWHCSPREIEDRCGVGPIVADELGRVSIAAGERTAADQRTARSARSLLTMAGHAFLRVDGSALRGRATAGGKSDAVGPNADVPGSEIVRCYGLSELLPFSG